MTSADSPPKRITPLNWQSPENLRWSFLHMDELFPSAAIKAGPTGDVFTENQRYDPDEVEVPLPAGGQVTVKDLLTHTGTDAWMLLRGRDVILEEYYGEMNSSRNHLLMSVSKSIVSSVLGVLVGNGHIDETKTVDYYVPQLGHSGYRGATVRNVLDMRSGVRFSEDYSDASSEIRKMDEAIGFAVPAGDGNISSLKGFLGSLEQAREHGGFFEYRSCETDVLGWICEEVSGRPFAALTSEVLWRPLGAVHDAYITLDGEGTGIFDGGICASLRDTARFGALIRDRGLSLTGNQILPTDWVHDLFEGGADSFRAFASGPTSVRLPGRRYRSQFFTKDRDTAYCWGIHGQMVYINRKTGIVGVKFSSAEQPLDRYTVSATAAMFDAINDSLASFPAPSML